MSGKHPTVVVIGGGIIGSWTALHLAEMGIDTVLLEQFPFPHTRGSSHGGSRAFRFLGEATMDRLDYSMERWRALEKALAVALFQRTGLINLGPRDDAWLERHMEIMACAGKPCDRLSPHALSQRFPSLRYPDEWGAAWDPNGGILFAHRCVNAVQSQFLKAGGTIQHGRAQAIETLGGGSVDITLSPRQAHEPKTLSCDRVVVASGPWTAELLPSLSQQLKTIAIPVTYWRDLSGEHAADRGFPIIYNARLAGIYGLPAAEYPGLAKVLCHDGPEAHPDARDVPDRSAYINRVAAYVGRHLPGLDARRPAIVESCMYTMTPDGEPIIDRLGEHIVAGCGFSGSGFKHSPATGRMLAALASDSDQNWSPGYEWEKYRNDRFQA